MIVSPHTGKLVHHDNCTYCVLRHKKDIGTKSRKKEHEKCLVNKRTISTIASTKERYCEKYIQVGCECAICKDKYERFDVETLLANKNKLW